MPWQEFYSRSDSEVGMGEIAPLLTHTQRESVCGYDQKRRPKTRKIREGREEGRGEPTSHPNKEKATYVSRNERREGKGERERRTNCLFITSHGRPRRRKKREGDHSTSERKGGREGEGAAV